MKKSKLIVYKTFDVHSLGYIFTMYFTHTKRAVLEEKTFFLHTSSVEGGKSPQGEKMELKVKYTH